MTKSLMISIQPQHALNILKGFKTEELRKSVPKGFRGWVYIYVTLKRPVLINKNYISEFYEVLNGKVVARFWFDEYIKLEWLDMTLNHNPIDRIYNYHALVKNVYFNVEWFLPKLCLTKQQVIDYGKGKDLYAWHIKKLEVFDKPMELKNFHKLSVGKETSAYIRLDKAPQSWQYVYVKGERK